MAVDADVTLGVVVRGWCEVRLLSPSGLFDVGLLLTDIGTGFLLGVVSCHCWVRIG